MGKLQSELNMHLLLLVSSCLVSHCLASPLIFHSPNTRVPNPCLTKANDTCIFPFTYNGVEYYRCTYADSPTPWCATMVDPNNTVVTNRWGDCSTSQFSNCPEDTPDLPSCTAESGASCVFPFRHLGITYTSCAATDLLSSAWCSGYNHNNHHHIHNHNIFHFHHHHRVHYNHNNNHHSCRRLETHLQHSVRPCSRKALCVPLHLAGEDLQLLHQGGGRPGQALVLHHGRPSRQPYRWPGTVWILLSNLQPGTQESLEKKTEANQFQIV